MFCETRLCPHRSGAKHIFVTLFTQSTTMFVLVSMAVKLDPFTHGIDIQKVLNQSTDEYVVAVFLTKELAIQSISTYAGTLHAGKASVIYEMLPEGDKQKRVRIYEATFPVYAAPKEAPKKEVEPSAESNLKVLDKRLQKLEEKLDTKCAECNVLKNENSEMHAMIIRMKKLNKV